MKSQCGLHSTLKEQSLCTKEYSESQGALPATLLKYWIISSIMCQVIIPVHVSRTSTIWYIKRQAGYITCLDLIRTQNPCLFFVNCKQCIISQSTFLMFLMFLMFLSLFSYSLPTKSLMQSACPSIIPLVHYLLPEHKPRICLAVVLVAWRLFQSQKEHFSYLTWEPDAIWEALEYLSHPSELITQNLWEMYTVFKWQVERCRTFSSCEVMFG